MEQILQEIQKSPIIAFTILLLVILIVPPIFERLRLPGLVGLLTAGIFLGPDGLGVLNAESENMKLLSDIGKIYLMFVAGLEIDLEDFRRTKNRSLGFGIATFLIPLIFGMTVGRFFNFGWNASILIGSLLASHTLLGFPIITRLGVTSNQAVTVTIGATIFTDIAALLVLAICVSISAGEFSIASVVMQLAILAIYSVVILVGFDWAGKEYFRRTGDEQSNQFLFVLLAVFLASVGAQIVNVDRIVGAFLAGLAVNDVVGHSPVEEKVEFVGSTLFIPFFFVNMGLLINLSGFVSSLSSELLLTLGIVGALISSKFLAAFTAKLLYGYNWNETLTMWSLSLPQVAATLAAALVGKNAGIITDSVFNTVIVLMLVTAILGPVLTEKFGRNLTVPQANLPKNPQNYQLDAEDVDLDLDNNNDNFIYQNLFKVIVPIYNPNTARYLIEMGALLAHHEKGIVVPLSIPKAHVYMDEPELKVSIKRSKLLLQQAITISEEFQAQAQPLIRIDDDLARGISRAAREQNADLIVMGWSPNSSLQARLFGNIIDNVFWSAHCPVAVMRLLDKPINIHRILVPVRSITPQILRVIQFAQLFADTNEAAVTLLQVCPRKTIDKEIALFESELSSLLNQSKSPKEVLIQTIRQDDVAKVIINQASAYDMVILRSFRRRTAGGLAVSDVTSKVLSEISCSMVLFGEPNSG
ncbi:cation:proton antiporter [Plectonema cf. radiosum LEGE 06105]|uniref:Cation:proton antiporter n=1 Tax=Plectonema cf. radiosum LEGE 06105 TaxID=945769 RepID=A0A8J7F4G7_9CYAN|nr:cation:proton antiporter [Plectonema radiosum]MBE9215878.1 cation:proton antiporter [Plectonema cf. radiosum LEGE 06105]